MDDDGWRGALNRLQSVIKPPIFAVVRKTFDTAARHSPLLFLSNLTLELPLPRRCILGKGVERGEQPKRQTSAAHDQST